MKALIKGTVFQGATILVADVRSRPLACKRSSQSCTCSRLIGPFARAALALSSGAAIVSDTSFLPNLFDVDAVMLAEEKVSTRALRDSQCDMTFGVVETSMGVVALLAVLTSLRIGVVGTSSAQRAECDSALRPAMNVWREPPVSREPLWHAAS